MPPQQGCPGPDGARDAASAPDTDTDTTGRSVDTTTTEEDTDTTDDSIADTAAEANQGDQAEEADRVEADGAPGPAVAPRITEGVFPTRYAGAMLAHAYLDRIGAPAVLTGLPQSPWRRFDPA
ncbi:MAG: hypothetical protein LC749_19235, partial [Actinobacteria bacterium]|nr:hypothetical protein [Actinomycetota bacterium]